MKLFGRFPGRSGVLFLCVGLLFGIGCGDCDDAASSGKNNGPGACSGEDCLDATGGSDAKGDGGSGKKDGEGTGQSDAEEGDGSGTPDAGPTCALQNRCAAECCTDEELCLSERCVTPGADCSHNLDCAQTEICEPMLGKCIPDPGVVCEWRPPTEVFSPEVTHAWKETDTTPLPEYHQVMMTPAVLDMNEDGVPDIIFSTFRGGDYNGASVLRAIDGRTHQPIFDLVDPEKFVSGAASVAVGDLDGDGLNEIVAVQPGGSGLIAFDDHTTGWAVKWKTGGVGMNWDGAALVDLDGDGKVEVVAANQVFNGETGERLCVAQGVAGGAVNSFAVDLDGDGIQEIIASNGAFKFVANEQSGYSCPAYWNYTGGGGGFPAAGDFGTFTDGKREFGVLDGIPEVVTAQGTSITLTNGQTGEAIWSSTLPTEGHKYYTSAECTTNGIGTPTVADFTGSGAPEVGAAGACFYVVFNTDGTLLWKHSSQDFSSRVTGSSVFDFQGDGKAEVVYADECFLRVYDGAGNGDGTTNILYKRSNTSGTTRELPVIVDVDGDHHADIVYIANDYSGVGNSCAAKWEEFDADSGLKHGIFVAKDSENRWVSTRPVWNQHAYYVTNVCDGIDDSLCPGRVNKAGAIPIRQKDNWEIDYLNNFRQNVQGAGLFNAPDFAFSHAEAECGRHSVSIRITVVNRGTRGILAGLQVGVWVTVDGTETYLTTLSTTRDLPPGGRETLEYEWTGAPAPAGQTIGVRAVADSDEVGVQQHNECNEDNNEIATQVTCACQTDEDCDVGEVCVNTGECLPMGG